MEIAFKYGKNNLIDYYFLIFILISFYYFTNHQMVGIQPFYFIIFVSFLILKFTEKGFTNLFRLKNIRNRYLATFIVLFFLVLISNIFLFIIERYVLHNKLNLVNTFDFSYIGKFVFINSIRVFGEEIVFRGFLLIKEISKKERLFWKYNIIQSLLFSMIHSLFVEELLYKFLFAIYVFTFSLFLGWINRKYNSLLPSWLIHWGNGLLYFIFLS